MQEGREVNQRCHIIELVLYPWKRRINDWCLSKKWNNSLFKKLTAVCRQLLTTPKNIRNSTSNTYRWAWVSMQSTSAKICFQTEWIDNRDFRCILKTHKAFKSKKSKTQRKPQCSNLKSKAITIQWSNQSTRLTSPSNTTTSKKEKTNLDYSLKLLLTLRQKHKREERTLI